MAWKDLLKKLWQKEAHTENQRPPDAVKEAVNEPQKSPEAPSRAPSAGQPAQFLPPPALVPRRFSPPRYQAWHQTQFPKLPKSPAKLRMVIGLDFGTSYTKVVLGEARIQYAVPMQEEESGEYRYLLPCILRVDQAGECAITVPSADSEVFTDLKIPLLARSADAAAQARVVAYLALVLRHCRGWLMNAKASVYSKNLIDWFINIGLPTDGALDEAMTSEYRAIVLAAWRLSAVPGAVTLAGAAEALAADPASAGEAQDALHPDAVQPFPEFAAQIAGYVRSPMCREGLHALIDVGAGTLDMAVFNVIDDDGDYRFPIFAKTVRPLGTQYLVRHRLEQAGYKGEWPLTAQDKVPSADEFTQVLQLALSSLRALDRPLLEQVRETIREQLVYTKRNKYTSPAVWKSGFPIFLCGGGAACDFYQDAFGPVFDANNAAWRATRAIMPRPSGLEAPGLADSQVDRLAVAYGLAFDEAEIGELVKPENILDDRTEEAARRSYTEAYVDKDMV